MPDVENHMDDFFKRAADNYPLKTSTGNWENLLPMMEAEIVPVATVESRSNRKLFLGVLVALIVSGSLLPLVINNPFIPMKFNEGYSEKITADEQSIKLKSTDEIINENSIPVLIPVAKEIKPVATTVRKGKSQNILTAKPTWIGREVLQSGSRLVKHKKSLDNNSMKEIISESNFEKVVNLPVVAANIQPEIGLEITDTVLGIGQVNSLPNKDTVIASKLEKNDKKKSAKFYFGLSAGVEQNTIKNQANTKLGLSVGLIAGLQINPQLAIEAGLQLTQKKYYTDGKYFQPKQGSMPSNMTVSSMYGTSTLIEIPIHVKFDFLKRNNTFYTSAGVSSFIMTSEKNKYDAIVSGQQQEINSTYHPMDKYISAMFSFGFGYQHALNNKLNIRIEPFFQIPLQGIGVGALPVTSKGFQIFISQRKK